MNFLLKTSNSKMRYSKRIKKKSKNLNNFFDKRAKKHDLKVPELFEAECS